MSGQYRTVALQAVGVAAIAAIIFVAFLRPEEPGDLSGIDAPGGDEPPIAKTPPDDGKRKKGKDRPGASDRREHGQGHSQGNRSGGASGFGDETFGDDGPTDDQYGDLVTRLLIEVGEPGLLRGIEPGDIEEIDLGP